MKERIEELEVALAKLKAEYLKQQTPTVIKPEFEAFEVYYKDLEGRFTWAEAKKACKDLGEGWRLPTKNELNEMYKKRDVVGGFSDYNYWSSTENDNYHAWCQSFANGFLGFQFKLIKNHGYSYVRAVRALTI